MFQKNCRDFFVIVSYFFQHLSMPSFVLTSHLLLFNFQGPIFCRLRLCYYITLSSTCQEVFEKFFKKLFLLLAVPFASDLNIISQFEAFVNRFFKTFSSFFNRLCRNLSATALILYHSRLHLSTLILIFLHFCRNYYIFTLIMQILL